VALRAGTDALKKRKIYLPAGNRNKVPSVVQPIALSLYRGADKSLARPD
jgi:hypothetical protein